MSRPWMPFYVGDYLRDTQHLSAEEHGAYLLLILHYWTHGELPKNAKFLRKISQLSAHKFEKYFENISGLFGPDWTHKRIDAEREKAMKITNKRKVAGLIGGATTAMKWGANAGANGPRLLGHLPTQPQSHEKDRTISEGICAQIKEPPRASPELARALAKLGNPAKSRGVK